MAKKGKGNQIGIYVIVGLLCFAMIGFGATNFGGSVGTMGQAGDRDISVQRYGNALNNMIRNFSAQTGQPLTFDTAQALGIPDVALQQVVSAAALEAETGRLGLSVGDEVVRDQILTLRGFQGLDGQFDREAYGFALRQNGMTEREFENDLRYEVSRTLLEGAIASGVAAPEAFTDILYGFIGERRSFTWARLDQSALTEPLPEPTEAQLETYFSENEDDFMLPETRRITYIALTPEMLAPTLTADEADVRALYQERINDYVRPERRLVERLILGAAAEDARARLDAGEVTFEELVAERDLSLTDIDLGDVTFDELDAAGTAVFESSETGVVGPVETPLGAALFRVNAILAPMRTSFEEARATLEREVQLEDADRLIGDEIQVIDDLLAGGASLEEVAAESPAELFEVDWTAETFDGIPGDGAFRRAAAQAAMSDFPEVDELSGGGLFALRLNLIIEPRLQDFADAREGVVEGWREEALVAALTVTAQPIADAIQAGETSDGVELIDEVGLTRTEIVPGTSPEFMIAAFEMEPGDVRVLPADGAVEILHLTEILPPDETDTQLAAQRDQLSEATRGAIGADILEAYTRAVQSEIGVTIDQAARQAVHVHMP